MLDRGGFEPPAVERGSSRGMLWTGAAVLIVAASALAAFTLTTFFGDEDDGPPLPTATVSATAPPVAGLRLTRAIALRSAPGPDRAIVTRLTEGEVVRVVGRSQDATWLIVGPTDRTDVVGWVPVDAVAGIEDLHSLAVVAGLPDGSPTALAGAEGSATPSAAGIVPDLPDLVVDRIGSRENRLTVVVRNDGAVDVTAPMFLTINDGDPIPIDIKPGEPLRPGEEVEAEPAGQFVQRRATVLVTVLTVPPVEEAQMGNNSRETIVSPDLPNDLGIVDMRLDGAEAEFVVTLRNNSPIPIRGSVTLRVREAPPGLELLDEQTAAMEVEPGADFEVRFPGLSDIDLTQVEVRMATDAINDADLSNDRFPR